MKEIEHHLDRKVYPTARKKKTGIGMMIMVMMAISITTLAKAAAQYLLEVWTSRVVVTLAIVVIWDAYHKYDNSSQQQ